MSRIDGRESFELRPVTITRNYIKYAEGSVLIEIGNTKVICTATVDEKAVPPFLKGTGQGWVTAEYSMLPRATKLRTVREASRGKLGGRTMEIQRLLGRSLRAAVNLKALGERTIWLDCDVIQADGGTRTASITGAFVALADAVSSLKRAGLIAASPFKDFVAAVSVGITDQGPALDLCYEEDSKAVVDMNLVMTGSGQFVELQGTGEGGTFGSEDLSALLELGRQGIVRLVDLQRTVLAGDLGILGLARS